MPEGPIDPETGLLREDVYTMLKQRADADPSLKRLKDNARAMQSGPVIGGLNELSQLRGGSGLDMNPLLAWASGLPGAPSNLKAIAQANPRKDVMKTLQDLMGMGNAAQGAQANYLKERDKFMGRQMGGGGGMSVADKIALERLENEIRQNKTNEGRTYKEGVAQGERDYKEGVDADNYDQGERDKAGVTYSKWTTANQKKQYGRITENAKSMLQAYEANPKSLYTEIGGHKFNQMALPSFFQSKEGKKFYSSLQGFINPILKGDIGSQQTRNEAKRFSKSLSVGTFDSFEELSNAYNRFLDGVAKEYDDSLKILKASPSGGYAYDHHWTQQDSVNSNYGKMIRGLKLPKLKSAVKKKSAPSPIGGRVEGNTPEAQDAFNFLLED